MQTPWQWLRSFVLEGNGVKEVFDHARNILVATLIITVGMEALERQEFHGAPFLLFPQLAGYGVTAIGVALVVLNFIDGLYKLSRAKHHRLWHAALTIAYCLLSLRLVPLIVMFRSAH